MLKHWWEWRKFPIVRQLIAWDMAHRFPYTPGWFLSALSHQLASCLNFSSCPHLNLKRVRKQRHQSFPCQGQQPLPSSLVLSWGPIPAEPREGIASEYKSPRVGEPLCLLGSQGHFTASVSGFREPDPVLLVLMGLSAPPFRSGPGQWCNHEDGSYPRYWDTEFIDLFF